MSREVKGENEVNEANGVNGVNKEARFLTAFDTMFRRLTSLNMYNEKSFLKEHQISEIHCIEAIWKAGDINVTGLTEVCHMTKGAVSKIVKKLKRNSDVESYSKPDNRKEVYLRLTAKGVEAAKRHKHFHETLENRDKVVFNGLKDSEKDAVIKFFTNFNSHLDERIAEAAGVTSQHVNDIIKTSIND